MKKLLFYNWHLMRFVRLTVALFLFYTAYETHEWFYVVFGLFFLLQSIFNLGCGNQGCHVNYKNKKNEE